MTTIHKPAKRNVRGVSVLELMVSIGILTVIMGAMFTFLSKLQQRYNTTSRQATMNQMGRTAFELLAIDLGQAGYPGEVNTTTTQAITGSNTAQTVTVASVAGMFVNRVVLVDTGVNQEAVRITAKTTTSITGLFKLSHATGAAITASMNPYSQGVLNTTAYSSTSSTLRIMGDLLADGSLRYIEYRFTAGANCTGTLVRSDTDAFAATQRTGAIVAERICNTAATGVFSYIPLPVELGEFVFVRDLTVSMTMETQRSVERSAGGASQVTVTQTFSPRNVNFAFQLSQDGLQTILPVAPGTVLTTLPAAP